MSDMFRGQRIGSSILKQVEKTAKERGCKYVFLDTFDLQVPESCKEYGYKEVFTLDEYPCAGKRYFFTKNL
ncbi:MAG: GNAT family N-acetyltransferase [Oscillospiraceae bacterium]|nr:GNAT family N-acetyltransferase [Oscillospiraceae bacterium]